MIRSLYMCIYYQLYFIYEQLIFITHFTLQGAPLHSYCTIRHYEYICNIIR